MRATFRTVLALLFATVLAACTHGPVRRVSEPTAQLQQLTVRADGAWDVQLRLQNYSSIPMRFDRVRLALTAGTQPAGDIVATPAVDIGPESADVVSITLQPSTAAKLAVADALAAGRGIDYALKGEIAATPEKKSQKTFDVEHRSALNPAPGLPGVLR
ncbi:LEA type 2 family protein [Cognatilysobacter lacus]|uniref:LEA type 2 family protein n=1 Tax=Cognatilysobacter lacus TaxID=1643323 RepID=A0A5D8YWV9_9GAMM|nr:LEA type 2 family protein [Lysobacter lacus]TZF87198.1 LEA type 2 family protein [Lysobacter lacus]